MAGVWWTRWLRILAVVLAFLVVLAATAAARTAHRRADLVERSVLVTPRTVAAGDTLRITDKVRNRGRAIAARSTVGYYLSRDRVRDAGDLRLGTRATRRLRRRATSTASRTMRIPSATAGGPPRDSIYHLVWDAASDDVSAPGAILYDIYQSTSSGGERYDTPTYTTAPGATSFDTPKLSGSQHYFFVVRARDEAGNRDSNTVERSGRNLCV